MKREDISYLTDTSRIIREQPEDMAARPCRVYVDSRGKKHPQHTYVLVHIDDKYVEWRCMYCLEYLTARQQKPGQQSLF